MTEIEHLWFVILLCRSVLTVAAWASWTAVIAAWEAGDIYLEASVYNGVEWYDCATTHTFTKDVTFENGKMYRLSATLEAEQ